MFPGAGGGEWPLQQPALMGAQELPGRLLLLNCGVSFTAFDADSREKPPAVTRTAW